MIISEKAEYVKSHNFECLKTISTRQPMIVQHLATNLHGRAVRLAADDCGRYIGIGKLIFQVNDVRHPARHEQLVTHHLLRFEQCPEYVSAHLGLELYKKVFFNIVLSKKNLESFRIQRV